MELQVFDQFIFDFHSCCKMLLDNNMYKKMIVINKLD